MNAEVAMISSAEAYRRNDDSHREPCACFDRRPPHQLPRARPAMNTERTVETRGVTTPNCAMAIRNQTTSYTRLQKPEMRKNPKNQRWRK
ncbi:MAG: hypothetical protein AUI47_00035 [Acidobacteria bacterium 13_1_40CM_2_68_5]|nr:MAG: hypothetical protein AUI47_00035 [Acidobacteria bacterium 13_1_40CM_2_68_5]